MPENGAKIMTDGRLEVDVQAVGTAETAARVSDNPAGPYRKVLDFLPEPLRVVGVIADDLERLVGPRLRRSRSTTS
jgi:hypothetical protein